MVLLDGVREEADQVSGAVAQAGHQEAVVDMEVANHMEDPQVVTGVGLQEAETALEVTEAAAAMANLNLKVSN